MTRWGVSLVIAVGICYLPHVLFASWVYEDAAWMQGLVSTTPTWQRGRGGFWTFLWLQWQVAPDPRFFHAVSVALHFTVAVLTGAWVRRLGLSAAAGSIAVVVVLLPALGVEAVAYAAQQGELLAAVAVLGTCIFAAGQWWRPAPCLGIVACLWLGFWMKETAIVALGMVPLVIASRARWYRWERPVWASPWLPAVLAGGVLIAGIVAYGGPLAIVNIGDPGEARVSGLDWLLVQSAAAMRTLGLLIVPYGLTVDYDYDRVPMVLRWLAVAGLAGLAVWAWMLRRSWIGLGLACMLVIIAPRLLIQTPRSHFNLHQAYLLLPGFALIVAAVYDKVRARC